MLRAQGVARFQAPEEIHCRVSQLLGRTYSFLEQSHDLLERRSVVRIAAVCNEEGACQLREAGVIRGFSADVDPTAAGLPLSALILVGAEQGEWRRARERLPSLPGVEWVALTSGEFDFVLLVRMRDIGTLRDVLLEQLHGMPEVRSTETIFILDEQRQPLDLTRLAH